MGYYIDFNTISLDEYRNILENAFMIPSQRALLENTEERFEILKAHGITNMQELQMALKTKKKVNQVAEKTALPADWLTILRREVNGRHPKPRKLQEFSCLDERVITALSDLGITTTVHIYDRIRTRSARRELASQIAITDAETLYLAKLTDVCRLRYVSPAFAILLVDTGYDTVERITSADYRKLYDRSIELNSDNAYYKGNIGKRDMEFLVHDAVNIPLDIEY